MGSLHQLKWQSVNASVMSLYEHWTVTPRPSVHKFLGKY